MRVEGATDMLVMPIKKDAEFFSDELEGHIKVISFDDGQVFLGLHFLQDKAIRYKSKIMTASDDHFQNWITLFGSGVVSIDENRHNFFRIGTVVIACQEKSEIEIEEHSIEKYSQDKKGRTQIEQCGKIVIKAIDFNDSIVMIGVESKKLQLAMPR